MRGVIVVMVKLLFETMMSKNDNAINNHKIGGGGCDEAITWTVAIVFSKIPL